MPSGFVRLSPPAEKLLFQIYAAYTARLESGLSERFAIDFDSPAAWPEEYSHEWFSLDCQEAFAELYRSDMIELRVYGGFTMLKNLKLKVLRRESQTAYCKMCESMHLDAFEISAHPISAPDHEPVQGRVFLKAEFEKMQTGEDFWDVDGKYYAGFPRPIAEWNCCHIAMPVSTNYSSRKWSDEQLAEWAETNARGCMIGVQHYTLFEITQLMEQIAGKVRRWKKVAVLAQAADDLDTRKYCQKKINNLARKYQHISEVSGLRTHKEQMSVYGFKMVKL